MLGTRREEKRRARDERDRDEVLRRVVVELRVDLRVDREHRAVGHEERVAVGRALADRGGGDRAVGARACSRRRPIARSSPAGAGRSPAPRCRASRRAHTAPRSGSTCWDSPRAPAQWRARRSPAPRPTQRKGQPTHHDTALHDHRRPPVVHLSLNPVALERFTIHFHAESRPRQVCRPSRRPGEPDRPRDRCGTDATSGRTRAPAPARAANDARRAAPR